MKTKSTSLTSLVALFQLALTLLKHTVVGMQPCVWPACWNRSSYASSLSGWCPCMRCFLRGSLCLRMVSELQVYLSKFLSDGHCDGFIKWWPACLNHAKPVWVDTQLKSGEAERTISLLITKNRHPWIVESWQAGWQCGGQIACMLSKIFLKGYGRASDFPIDDVSFAMPLVLF